eukprot:gene6753-4845_t
MIGSYLEDFFPLLMRFFCTLLALGVLPLLLCLSFSTDLLTSPTGLMALLYGRTPRASDAAPSANSTSSSRISKDRRRRDPPATRPPVWRRRRPHSRSRPSSERVNATGEGSGEQGVPPPRRGGAFRSEAVWLGGIILVLSAVWEYLSSHQDILLERLWQLFAITLEVRSSQQPEYAMIVDWMGRQPQGRDGRNVTLRPLWGSQQSSDRLAEDARELLVPGYGRHFMRSPDGRTFMWVHRYEDVNKAKRDFTTTSPSGHAVLGEHDVLRITFFSRDREVIPRFLRAVKRSWEMNVQHHVRIYTTNYASSWQLLAARPIRPLYTLYLPPPVRQVVDEVRTFLGMSEVYQALGIPWRRGYLLEGLPGTGKTSFVMALAGELGLPIHLLSLHAAEMDDESLIRLVSTLPQRCILLVEDIENSGMTYPVPSSARTGGEDVQQSMRVAEAPRPSVSLSAFLNAMDGVASSEGRVLIVTSNNPDRIPYPQAMLRPGRIDRVVHFAPLKDEELKEMQRRFANALSACPEDPEAETGVAAPSPMAAVTTQLSSTRLSTPAEYQLALLDLFYQQRGAIPQMFVKELIIEVCLWWLFMCLVFLLIGGLLSVLSFSALSTIPFLKTSVIVEYYIFQDSVLAATTTGVPATKLIVRTGPLAYFNLHTCLNYYFKVFANILTVNNHILK